MKLQKAERRRVKLRLNIASPSGFGKTYSALQIAFGLCGDWNKIAVIDTENDSAALYSHLGTYNTIVLKPPFTTEKYIEAITVCEQAGMEVIIIDSVTHVWKGEGGLLEYQAALGGTYQTWAKVTPLYQKFLSAILHSTSHVITTNRKKQSYNMVTDGNKTKVEKAGLDDEIRDGFEYEMTLALEIINDKHLARASKDRTGLFEAKPEFIITTDTGKLLLNWCNMGTEVKNEMFADYVEKETILTQIEAATNTRELFDLYKANPAFQESLLSDFTLKKQSLETAAHLITQNTNTNGSSKYFTGTK